MDRRLYPVSIDDVIDHMHETIFPVPVRNEVVIINGREGFAYQELVLHLARRTDRSIVAVPVPKITPVLLAKLLEITGLEMDLVPDQVPRLYSGKPYIVPERELLSIGEYFEDLAKGMAH